MKATGMKRGALIVFEGCDKAGKTTQCRKLVEKLRESGITAQMMQFPDRTTVTGRVISNYLLKKEELPDQVIHLLFSANRWESLPKIKQLLQEGVTLIVDRYAYSGVAYSAAKPKMDFDWCQKPEIGLPKPDLVFLLHLPSNKTNGRIGFGEERYENEDFLQNVYKNYLKMKKENWMIVHDTTAYWNLKVTSLQKSRNVSDKTDSLWMELIDASQSIEELHEDILKHTKEAIKKAQKSELEELW